MENNNAIINRLPIAVLPVLLTTLLTAYIFTDIQHFVGENPWVFRVVLIILPTLSILLGIGLATQEWKGTIAALLVFLSLRIWMLLQRSESEGAAKLYYLVMIASIILPYVVYFVFSGIRGPRLWHCILLTLLLPGFDYAYYWKDGMEALFELVDSDYEIPQWLGYGISYLVTGILPVIFIGVLTQYGKSQLQSFQARLFDPRNDYSKLTATIIVWISKLYFIMLALGSISFMKSMVEFLDDDYGSLSGGPMIWYNLYSIIAAAPLSIFAAWYMRKVMIEFFVQHRVRSKSLYWFITLPFVGIFGWLVMLADTETADTFSQRKEAIGNFAASSRTPVITIVGVLMGIRLLLQLVSGDASGIISTLVSAALLAAMIYSFGGYALNFYLQLGVLALLIIFLLSRSESMMQFFVLFPVLLFSISNLVVTLPVYHFEAFDYVVAEEEENKPWQPGDDLF